MPPDQIEDMPAHFEFLLAEQALRQYPALAAFSGR